MDNLYCYDLSMENFSVMYLDNFELEDKHTGLKKHIIKVLKAGFAGGIKQHIESINVGTKPLRKVLGKLLLESFKILNERINRDADYLLPKEMRNSKYYIDQKTVEYIDRYYSNSSDWKQYSLLSFYQIGAFHGIVYGTKRTQEDLKSLSGDTKMSDSDFPILVKEYNEYLKKHDIG